MHLHGQGTGFIQLNTQDETQRHTEKLGDFIAATLNSNPSLFIGYSGNADEFFPLLKDKYSEQHRLIWTGRKNSIDDIEAESVKEFLQENQNLTHYIGDIDADHFLIQLAKELDCFPPQLFLNPYEFLDTQLQNIQPYPLADGLDILEDLSKYLKEKAKQPLIESLYTAFIHKYPNQKSTQDLSDKAINEIMWAYNKQAEYLIKQEKIAESVANYEQALGILPTHLGCLNNYAIALANLAQIKQDQTLFEKSLKHYEKALAIQPEAADTLGNYGNALSDLALFKKDEVIFEKALKQYEKALAIETNHARHLGNYANALTRLAQIKQDQTLFAKAFELFEKALQLEPNHATRLGNYAAALSSLAQVKQDRILFEKALQLEPNKTYNLACYYAVLGKADLCQKYLLHAENHNTLPLHPYQHLTEDRDLDSVRHEAWFIEILSRLQEKETITEKSS
ncbi:tetratricopeptide repeat protein [uncultured Acinetobacter sp.]|uniref:tetratricopeptide repeat protein n=1 Tax=uncultured Acinetobacter sp. TaxID=165433 RepID=UPI00261D841B|nr:tetratricopeptide repeat protein [uncultured Acinetobacter sp.]